MANDSVNIGNDVDFSGASTIAIGPNSIATHIVTQFFNGTLTESQVEDLIRRSQDVHEKVEKHSLIQSITNLPRAEAVYSDYQSQKKNGLCLKGTRETILGELTSWVFDPTMSQIYVLSGLAGIGKSTIAYTFASRADKLGILAASFFFSRDESDRKTAKRFFTTIAYQLCLYDRMFAQAIGNALQKERGSAAVTKDLNEQLEALILEPLRDAIKSRIEPIMIVIDALDECDDRDAPIVLASLERLVHSFPCFKVLLTTRSHPRLNHRLISHDVFYLQHIEDKIINNDIRLYLKFWLSGDNVAAHLPGLINEWRAADEEIEYLVKAAGKLFIVAAIAVRIILDTTARNPASQMKVLMDTSQLRFNDLESFYVVILRRVLPEKCSSEIKERFKTVIGAILFVQEPLPVPSLQHFTHPYTLDDIDAVLKNLESVITNERNTPRIYHKSFFDFLTEMCHKYFDIRFISKDQHRQLATHCLRVLNEQLKRNILDLTGPARFMENTAGIKDQGISEGQFREKLSWELDYACKYWAIHLEGANIANVDAGYQEMMQELSTFANKHLPHWIEVMSWIRNLDLAFRALRIIHRVLDSKTALTELRQLFADALRFISKFYPVLQQSALHTYHSALSFTPTETLFYKRYHEETVNNVCQVQGTPANWSEIIAHPNHENVDRVIFSQDSSMFASLNPRSVKFWDAFTGAPIGTIVDKVSAIADDFSTAASYSDSTIVLYNVNSCNSVTTLNVAPASVVQLAMSPDGLHLAAGLSDCTVCLMNWRSIDPGARLDRFAWDKERGFCCLTFNSSGDRLAFGTIGGMVLRNGISGEFIAEMKHGESNRYPSCVTFSRDDSRLAYRDECQLSLWDGKNGTLIGITNLKKPGQALAISGDGALIAIDQDSRITLWNLNSRNSLKVVKSIQIWQRPSTLSIAFHPNNLFVIIRDFPPVFRNAIIYDIEHGVFLPCKSGHCFWKRPLYIWNFRAYHRIHKLYPTNIDYIMGVSLDNTRAIMSSGGTGLQLVDLENALLRPSKWLERRSRIWFGIVAWFNDNISSLVGLTAPVTRLNFSPDCLRLVSCHDDGTTGLWDTNCSRRLITLLTVFGKVRSCVFSADGSDLVSTSLRNSVMLWDCRNGAPINMLKPKYPKVTSMVFLRNMLAVQSKTYDNPSKSDITLWNLETSRPIVCVTNDSSELSEVFHHDTMLIYYTTGPLSEGEEADEDVDVTVWDVEKRSPHAMIHMGTFFRSIELMAMSPDKSQLVVQLVDGNVKIFNLNNRCEEIMLNPRREVLDLDWLPPMRSWHGVPVWLHRSTENGLYCVSGRSSRDRVPITVLWIEGLEGDHVVARGSSMFALIYDSNQIILLRQSPTGSFN